MLKILERMRINDGSILVHGEVTYVWQHVLFWRVFLMLTLHYLAILGIAALSLKLGWFSQKQIDSKIEDILERPQDDTATMFSFVKQSFYHKSLAYTKHEKHIRL